MKTTQKLWDEYCGIVHKSIPSSWITVSPRISEKLNKLKNNKGNGRK
jgi:hypothetical protein